MRYARPPHPCWPSEASSAGTVPWPGAHSTKYPTGSPYALAHLVAAAIERGMHPREWEAAKSMPEHDMDLATGHRPPQRPQPRVDLVYGESVEFRQA